MRLAKWFPAESTSTSAQFWFIPINLIAILLLVPKPGSLSNHLLEWFGLAFLTQGITTSLIYFFQNLCTSPVGRVLLLSLVGAARGGTIASISLWSTIQDPALPVGRVINSTLTVVIWSSLIGRALHSSNSYAANYRSLIGQATTSTLALINSEYRSITNNLSQTLKSADSISITDENLRRIASEIRAIVEERIRPFSHRIWFGELTDAPKSRLRSLFADSLSLPVPITRDYFLVSIPMATIGIIVIESDFNGVRELLGLILASLPALLGLQRLSNFLQNQGQTKLNLLIAALFGFISSFGGHAINQFIDPTQSSTLSLTGLALGLSLYAVLVTMFRLAEKDKLLVVQTLTEVAASPREIASFVHNTVQSGLLASASALELASTTGDREKVKTSLQTARELVGLDLTSDFSQRFGDPRQRLHILASSWKGIAEIDVLMSEEIADHDLISCIEILEEAIANAVRKAHANRITIEVTQDSTSLIVSVQDNGRAIPGESGLGTAWLDSISNGNWNRRFFEVGSELVVTIPRII